MEFSAPLPLILMAALAYLLGSIPFGLLLTRAAGLGDIRQIGSGNIGATNVLRTGKKWLAALTLILDAGKAYAAVFLASQVFAESLPVHIAALCALIGHLFPLWLKFKGGKGVAVGLGVSLALDPVIGVCLLLTWLLVAIIFRYSSLAALAALLAVPGYLWCLGRMDLMPVMLPVIALMLYKHRDNIRRLYRGEESKISLSGKSQPDAKTAR